MCRYSAKRRRRRQSATLWWPLAAGRTMKWPKWLDARDAMIRLDGWTAAAAYVHRMRTYMYDRTKGNPDLLQKHRIGDVDVASAIHVQDVFFSSVLLFHQSSIPCIGWIHWIQSVREPRKRRAGLADKHAQL